MSIIVTQNVKQYTITATQEGNSVELKPVILVNGESFDGIVNGGTP